MRLAADRGLRELPASVDDSAHELVREQALSWQQIAGHATFWEMAAEEADEGTGYALAGQMASVGEQLGLAYAAGVEVALWQESNEDHAHADVTREICMRGMAEAQALFVIGAAHALANVLLRALTLRPDLKAGLIKRFPSETVQAAFDPFSSNPADWISMNKSNGKKLSKVAELSNSHEIIALAHSVSDYAHDEAWEALLQRRGEDFHRWRPQSHGIQGVARKSPWQHDGATRSLGIGQPIYDEGSGLAEKVAQVADNGMLRLAAAMKTFLVAWPAASSALGGPIYEVSKKES